MDEQEGEDEKEKEEQEEEKCEQEEEEEDAKTIIWRQCHVEAMNIEKKIFSVERRVNVKN